jgi:4-nitrophenyl phosphatase/phosphoglycolate phosphatase
LTPDQKWPGAGAIVGAIQATTGVTPELVGKPTPLMIELLMLQNGLSETTNICMVGDRLDTDILFGVDNGLRTILTLSGVTSSKASAVNNIARPELVIENVRDLVVL